MALTEYRIVFFEGDYEVRAPGMHYPVGIFRSIVIANRFIEDLLRWEAEGAEPACRPASNADKYL